MTATSPTRRSPISAAALVAAVALGAPARAEAGPLDEFLGRIKEALDAAAAARVPRPPVPVPVKWEARKLGSLALAAPLVALEFGDLDRDGRDELVGLTTGEILVLAAASATITARAPLPPAPALIRSRDPVGTLVIDGAAITARTSEQAAAFRYRFAAGKLVLEPDPVAGFPLCAALTAELSPGRNHFDEATARWTAKPPVELAAPFYAVECREHAGADGKPMATFAVADLGRKLAVSCLRPGGQTPCPADALAATELDAGYAFEVADVDRDGHVEVIAARAVAPGRKDQVRAYGFTGGQPRQVFDHRFDGGVVALAAPDLDGDGALEVIAAVRLWGQTRIDLWVLTRPQ